ncbi:MAG: Y-family DNA polymerase [Bacteroidaceae bacterium]|nr:Y-family DNA polymerase [Bacteroidaceae bacterium]
MFALVDCNSFFCSVEKVFHPGLDGRPVCVLSSNDGCIVALTPEAKAVGLHRGDPIFKMKDIVEKHQVILFSTNMPLYAAMSRRVTSILRLSVHHVENYSIDESFCDLRSFGEHFDLTKLMREVRQRIKLWTDIPVSIGIAPSKTLAKMGSKFAKQYQGYRGVCMIDTEEKRRKALEIFALSDVWGIGRRTLEVLNYYGIHTPLQFADKKESWVRAHFHQPGVQTWMELNGIPCIDTSEVIRNQNICTSRSFGDMVSDLPSLKASVASFASSCANKLRGQQSVCQSVTVFVSSNSFRTDLPQYGNAATVLLATPTADTLEINKAAMQCLESVYLPGIMYKKSGVLLGKISPAYPAQMELFNSPVRRMRRENLMHALDDINQRYGAKTLHLAVEDCGHQPWHVKCEHRSPNYLTDINEILTIRI